MMAIDWQPWGEEAFARAQRANKPVLLSIGAVWCHWCHVMDRTTYADERVAEKINGAFVAIRVDNDERPDINARYNMGGWPTTAFLSGTGTILTGATYLPAPQMLHALDDISKFYAENRDEIDRRSAELGTAQHQHAPATPDALRAEAIAEVVASLERNYDEEYGGFGDAPKFPQPDALEFLLGEWRIGGDARLYDMVARTMREMARGGMYDHVEGGFFRYSTTRDWSIPHFEKMAEDHAGLLRVLAQLLLWARANDLRPTLVSALGWVRTVLRDPQTQLFGGSQDADEAYYARPLEERRAGEAPFVDRRSYTAWTADLAGAFCWCAAALDDDALLDEASGALEIIAARLHDDDGLLYHVTAPDGTMSVRGLFADQAAYVRACLDAYEALGHERFLDRAIAHAHLTMQAFEAPDGGFYDHRSSDAIGRLQLADRPIVENGRFAETLLRLSAITGDERYRAAAERTLLLYAQTFTRAGAFGATYARAMRRYLSEPMVLTVGREMPGSDELREAARRLPTPFVSIASDDGTRSHLCIGTRCGEPFESAAALRARYEALV